MSVEALAAAVELCLQKRAAGVSAALGVSLSVAEDMVWQALQQSHNPLAQQPPGEDTGATVRVIGKHEIPHAVNITRLPKPILVNGAGGKVLVTEVGDLPGVGGLMQKCLLMPLCESSLLPVQLVCEELDLEYRQGPSGDPGFYYIPTGECVAQLERSGSLVVVPSDLELCRPVNASVCAADGSLVMGVGLGPGEDSDGVGLGAGTLASSPNPSIRPIIRTFSFHDAAKTHELLITGTCAPKSISALNKPFPVR